MVSKIKASSDGFNITPAAENFLPNWIELKF